MMKKYLTVIFLYWAVSASAQKSISLQLSVAPQLPTLLGEGFISTFMNERDFALSPDGREMYFTVSTPKSAFQTIVFCKRISEREWTMPEVASFAGEFSDLEPAFSADGNVLYFSSNRPTSGAEPKDFDIWKVKREGNGWSKPENKGTPINTEADEFYPSITKSGNLYYTAQYKGGVGKEDIYVSVYTKGVYQTPVALDTAVNSKTYEFNAFVSPDEKYILFTSYGRKDDTGGGDLYISVKDDSGKWTSARNLKELNSKQLDYCPYVSPDGKRLFFTSERHDLQATFLSTNATFKMIASTYTNPLNGTGNIYWIDFQRLLNEIVKQQK